MPRRTHSELLLEEYLTGLSIEYEYEPREPGKASHPDFRIQCADTRVWLEVKEFEAPEQKPTNGFDPRPAITEKIGQARRQFKEYKNHSCALILHGCKSIYRSTPIDTVLSAMFGEHFYCTPLSIDRIDDVPSRFRFSGSSTLSHNRKTTISAVIILQHWHVNELWVSVMLELLHRQARGDKLSPGASCHLLAERQDEPIQITHADTTRSIVLENPYARIPFPHDLCNGPFDQRWGRVSDDYTLVWIGSGLEELRQRPEPVPFVYL